MSPANAALHCNHTGFNGGPGVCGTFCDSYCNNILSACTGGDEVFNSWDACMQECSYYPRDWNFNLSSPAVATLNSIDCRAWHSQVATNASGNSAAVTLHCGHASPQGGGYCGTTGCDNYCDNVGIVCTGDLMQWTDRAQCMAACMTFPEINTVTLGGFVTSGNSLPCRKYHATVAGTSPASAQVHCLHTGPLGGSGWCGQECEGLCNIAVGACNNSLTVNNCMNMCMNLTSSSTANTTEILQGMTPKGSVGCATYWSLKALGNPGMCGDVTSNLMAKAGGSCTSGATLVQASWAVIALVFLALGFTS